jgi:arginine decarboxylase
MTDVPDLPNFSHFHDTFRKDAGSRTNEGDIRGGFYAAYDAAGANTSGLLIRRSVGV